MSVVDNELFKDEYKVTDEYGNIHYKNEELARGGQGVVYRTTDSNLAIKQPLNSDGQIDMDSVRRERFRKLYRNIRTLPLPKGIHISLPLANFREEPGYVMKLLKDMRPFAFFSLNGEQQKKDSEDELPVWLSKIENKKDAQKLAYYAKTGSTRFRLYALYKCASILARLHNAGIVYGDISENNVFIGENVPCECWLIDADNLRLEPLNGGCIVYTPGLGAPELVQLKDSIRPRTDCWAFAVMAFHILALCHPFIGKMVKSEESEGGWDSEPSEKSKPSEKDVPADLDEQAYAGYMPYIDDEEDDSNECSDGLPRILVLTSQLRILFQETFGVGRLQPHRRPSMSFWALELARAFDNSIVCPSCKMSYFNAPDFKECPYCGNPRPAFVIAKTDHWQMNLLSDNKSIFQALLPHRLFNPFSLASGDDTEYEADIDLEKKIVKHVRGTKPFPSDLTFEFVNTIEQNSSSKESI